MIDDFCLLSVLKDVKYFHRYRPSSWGVIVAAIGLVDCDKINFGYGVVHSTFNPLQDHLHVQC